MITSVPQTNLLKKRQYTDSADEYDAEEQKDLIMDLPDIRDKGSDEEQIMFEPNDHIGSV
jgi:hypothetical protein